MPKSTRGGVSHAAAAAPEEKPKPVEEKPKPAAKPPASKAKTSKE